MKERGRTRNQSKKKEEKRVVWRGRGGGVTVFVNSLRKSAAKSGLNEEVTQCNVLQTAGRIAAIPLRVLSQRRVSPEIRPTGTIHHRSRRKKRTWRREYKKGGDSKGEEEDRKEGAGPHSKASGDAWQRQSQNRLGGSFPLHCIEIHTYCA